MLGQASFSDFEYANKKRRTRRELFLAEMDAVVPWPKFWSVYRARPSRRERQRRTTRQSSYELPTSCGAVQG
jgi:hypothetical protein